MENNREVTKRDLLRLRVKCCESGMEMADYFHDRFSNLIRDRNWYKEVPEDSLLSRKYVSFYFELEEKLKEYSIR